MGVYNPHAPRILGQEWVPIKDRDLVLTPFTNIVEVGHTFTPTANRTLLDGRFYVKDFPAAGVSDRLMCVSVYQTGYEAATGPIREVIIPVNNGGISGGAFAFSPNTGIYTTVPACLANPSDVGYIVGTMGSGAAQGQIGMFFSVNQYAQQLVGKRILEVNIIYQAAVDPNGANPVEDGTIWILTDNGTNGNSYGNVKHALFTSTTTDIQSSSFGETVPQDNSSSTIPSRKPWTYADLARFEASASSRMGVYFRWLSQTPPGGIWYIQYAALQVKYCVEQRVAVGYGSFGSTFLSDTAYVLGANPITMIDPQALTINPVLTSGVEYTATLCAANNGENDIAFGIQGTTDAATLNSDLELYQIQPHRGVKVLRSLTVGDSFTKETLHELPQLTLCASGAPLREMHVYGQQVAAPIYDTITASQQILDSAAGGAASWPWVRFYARRWGDTTIPLLLSSPTITGSSVQISVSDFDALDEIIDGWKEVTLRFTTPPTMGAGTSPSWQWSATGENSGNRWEILGATAPALSGVPGNLLNTAPSPTGPLGTATYGAPGAGSSIELTWKSPSVSAITADSTSDAVLIFAQDLPAVTGLAATARIQEISGIGQDCGGTPCCIPSGIRYNQITWAATSSAIPVSGFGYYELQRSDTVTDWATVMAFSSPTGATFNDYEARVGISTSYRIRAVDVYGFYNDWSSTVSITTTAPGVTGGSCLDNGHLLIFTSNEHQNGSSNLAHATVWDSGAVVSEDFTFSEFGFNVLQPMYGKDFYTAFRPTERGGVQFTRTLMVQAAAISPETLADFTNLRDMAWDQLSYVCVRDEEGNRWFANVGVPSAQVQLNRTMYMAPVTITQVTSTPSQVDPAA